MTSLKSKITPLTDPLIEQNPLTYLVLGYCSALAVTVQMKTSLVMTGAVIFVMTTSSTVISLLRKIIPQKVKIIIQLVIISSMVIASDQFLKAYLYDISKQLSVFVALIITNCIVMGRTEAYAMHNKPLNSFLDGLGNASGYGLALISVAFFRELIGSGSIYGKKIIPQYFYEHGYSDSTIFVLAPGAFFIMGLLIWLINTILLKLGKPIEGDYTGHSH